MSRRQIYICDQHDDQGEEVIIERDNYIGFDGEWWKIGFCPLCDKELIATARELIQRLGIKVPPAEVPGAVVAPKANPARVPKPPNPSLKNPNQQTPASCIWCPYEGTIASLNNHVKKHGFKGFNVAFGSVCPLCNQDGFQLLGRHAFAHKTANVIELFNEAIRLGDPHGVVAERLKAAA